MSAFGIAITKITSRFGLLSRKASVRLAKETGIRLVDKANQVGRALQKSEIEEVFAEILPKRCRPKVCTDVNELPIMKILKDKRLKRFGVPESLADDIAGSTEGIASLGSLYIRPNICNEEINSVIAHELQHVLDNKRPTEKLKKLLLPVSLLEALTNIKKFKKLAVLSFDMQYALKGGIVNCEEVINACPNKAGIAKYASTNLEGLREEIRQVIRGKIDPTSKLTTKASYNTAIATLNKEIPAYSVGGEVEHYAKGLSPNQTTGQTSTSIIYEEASQILQEEKALFKRNKRLGILELPFEYGYDRNFSRLIKDNSDREFVQKIFENIDGELSKGVYYKALIGNIDNIKAVQEFMKKANMSYADMRRYSTIWQCNPEILSDPRIIKNIKNMISMDRKNLTDTFYRLSRVEPEALDEFLKSYNL